MFLVFITGFHSQQLFAQVDTAKKVTLQDSAARPHPFQYDKDAGLQYKKGDFTLTTWAYAERLFAGNTKPAWRRVRQGMEFKFPSYNFLINGNKYRTAFVYEVDFTDNNFLKEKVFIYGKIFFFHFKMQKTLINSGYCLVKTRIYYQGKTIYHPATYLPLTEV